MAEGTLELTGNVIWTGPDKQTGAFRFGLKENRDANAIWFGIADEKLRGFVAKGDNVTVTYTEDASNGVMATFIKKNAKKSYSGGKGGGGYKRTPEETKQIVQQALIKSMAALLDGTATDVEHAFIMMAGMIERSKELADQLISGKTPAWMVGTAKTNA